MKTNIMGTAVATVQQMQSYIQKVNPAVPKSVIDMVEYYISEGKTEGVRGDIAFAQSCLETGNFTFNGSAVTLDQNNFCRNRRYKKWYEREFVLSSMDRHPGTDPAS